MHTPAPTPKTAFLAIVGRPNVGKSSLLNLLIGRKVAIVTKKPQTTRTRIMGVLTEDDIQYVFIDTPGLHKPRTRLGERMVAAAEGGLADADACLLVAEAHVPPGPTERELAEKIKKRGLPAVLVLNKIDLLRDKAALLPVIGQYRELCDFEAVVPVSCLPGKEDGIEALKTEISKYAVEHPHFFDADMLTDQPERVMAAEIVREKLLVLLDDEVPHGIAVDTERFAERKTAAGAEILDIEAMIYCERESHKGIIIGKNGAMIKKAGTLAREELEMFFGCRVNLQLRVKVKPDWRNKQGLIRSFGLDGQ